MKRHAVLINALLADDLTPDILEYGDLNYTGGIDIGDVTALIYILLTQ